MEHPLTYYKRRNALIVTQYKNGHSLAYLCDCHNLKEARMRQIVGLPRTDPKPLPPALPSDLLKRLKLSPYRVRRALLSLQGRWPYPICGQS